jgi:hypothetical protein
MLYFSDIIHKYVLKGCANIHGRRLNTFCRIKFNSHHSFQLISAHVKNGEISEAGRSKVLTLG